MWVDVGSGSHAALTACCSCSPLWVDVGSMRQIRPKRVQDRPKRPQDRPKTIPKGSQRDPRPTKTLPSARFKPPYHFQNLECLFFVGSILRLWCLSWLQRCRHLQVVKRSNLYISKPLNAKHPGALAGVAKRKQFHFCLLPFRNSTRYEHPRHLPSASVNV